MTDRKASTDSTPPGPQSPLDLTDAEWAQFQQIPEQGYSHRHWLDRRNAQALSPVLRGLTARLAAFGRDAVLAGDMTPTAARMLLRILDDANSITENSHHD